MILLYSHLTCASNTLNQNTSFYTPHLCDAFVQPNLLSFFYNSYYHVLHFHIVTKHSRVQTYFISKAPAFFDNCVNYNINKLIHVIYLPLRPSYAMRTKQTFQSLYEDLNWDKSMKFIILAPC